ncbi:hypothetical protein SAMN02799631_01978 [Methylobacterium sp. 174MFSha1.1]|uniref:hypothetical protein n=1 Tax=Methylobacterium sp. 174MFSha1.1 TaxID=1502749 RepID=UPI0008E514BD|nr:hypothetical protein [Methylobacterium sp. 174MFSha1.1]SFU72379.1 hypothetical protein SAMN02799631_01978 [Methylobacterium sp. 174MFSha1.1]
MPGILDWLGGRRSSGRQDDGAAARSSGAAGDPYARLSARLGDYPPDTPLHRGDPRRLTREQRAENLTRFLARDADRIAVLVSRLAREGLDGAAVLKGDDAALAEGRRIDAWLAGWVPHRPFDPVRGDTEVNAPRTHWFASDRAGADLVFSFVSDLARLNAAAIAAADPLFSWAVVEDALDAAITGGAVDTPKGEPSDRRHHLCLVRDLSDGSVPVVLDLPLAVLDLMHGRMSPLGLPAAAAFPIGLQAVLSGAYARP